MTTQQQTELTKRSAFSTERSDLPKECVLILCDEAAPCRKLSEVLGSDFRVYTAESVARARTLLEAHPIQVMVVSQGVAASAGPEFLVDLRASFPDITPLVVPLPPVHLPSSSDGAAAGTRRSGRRRRSYSDVAAEVRAVLRQRSTQVQRQRAEIGYWQFEEPLAGQGPTREDILRTLAPQRDHAEFIGQAAHDLRNPLTVIVSLSELMMSDPSLSDTERREFLQMIHAQASDMHRLLDDMLNISRIESGKVMLSRSDVPVAPFVEQIVGALSLIGERKGIALRANVSPHIGTAWFDPQGIRQVLDNLVGNAFKFSMADTTVTVEVREAAGGIAFSVVDQGIGIKEEDRERIFQPFARGSNRATGGEPSTGLGLAICRRIVELHGGSIELESQEGAGSCFVVYLPGKPAGA